MTPAGVRQLVGHGHRVLVERGAGVGSGLPDELYVAAGATIVPGAGDVWGADMIVKVKEPLPAEYPLLPRRARSSTPTCTWRPSRR